MSTQTRATRKQFVFVCQLADIHTGSSEAPFLTNSRAPSGVHRFSSSLLQFVISICSMTLTFLLPAVDRSQQNGRAHLRCLREIAHTNTQMNLESKSLLGILFIDSARAVKLQMNTRFACAHVKVNARHT